MTIVNNNMTPVTKATPSSSGTLKTNMDYDGFLKLFMAQMKNQDPTKPNDPTETLSQLASFSNVEQSIKVNGKLDSILSTSTAALASAFIGKTVGSLDGSVEGVVTSVAVEGTQLTATLKDGRTLDLNGGYRVGAA